MKSVPFAPLRLRRILKGGDRVERVNVPIDGAAAEHQPARRREHRAPVGATGIAVRPHALAGIDVRKACTSPMRIRRWG